MSDRVKYSVPELHRLWASGASYDEIAAALGCTSSFVTRLKSRHKLPNRERLYSEPTGDPAPDELERLKREVFERHMARRRGETDEQTRKRVWYENRELGIADEVA